jgi:CubicO group peptidase (beta-lactamase class C family)
MPNRAALLAACLATVALGMVVRAQAPSTALFARWSAPDSPGCAVGVSLDGVTLYERAYGMANLELNVSLSSGAVFDAASISKLFTAMSVMLLAERGRLSIDDEVRALARIRSMRRLETRRRPV